MSEIIDTFWQCMTLCATEILLKNAVMPLPLKRKVLRTIKAGAKKRPTAIKANDRKKAEQRFQKSGGSVESAIDLILNS